MLKTGTGLCRWAGLLMVNYQESDGQPDCRCKTELVDETGKVVATIEWSSRSYAARAITCAENDFRKLIAEGTLTAETVVSVMRAYEA